jgi:hypothetical protein
VIAERVRRSPPIDFTGYRQISATLPTTVIALASLSRGGSSECDRAVSFMKVVAGAVVTIHRIGGRPVWGTERVSAAY